VHAERHVAPVDFAGACEALGPVHRVGRQADELVRYLEQIEPKRGGERRSDSNAIPSLGKNATFFGEFARTLAPGRFSTSWRGRRRVESKRGI
jgi:hypothetical protein